MSQELNYFNCMAEYLSATDAMPKNAQMKVQGTISNKYHPRPKVVAYNAKYHKDLLVRKIKHSITTGYEIDKSWVQDNGDNTRYIIYCGRLDINISTEDYISLWEEVKGNMKEEH